MKIHTDTPLSDIVHYRIGGKAKTILEVRSKEELIEALEFAKRHDPKTVLILGLGSNVLLPDTDVDGIVIWMRGTGTSFSVENSDSVTAFAGELFDDLIQFSFAQSLRGLEWAGGLPSTVGGAIRGNAGAFGSEVKDSIQRVEYIDMTDSSLAVQTLSHKDCQFSYRDSLFKKNPHLILLNGTFHLQKVSAEELEEAKKTYERNIAYRKEKHPVEYPSCGSVFKNITRPEEVTKVLAIWPDIKDLSQTKWHNKISMGYAIDRLGFTGKKVGGAKVSDKHSNYIINTGNAKAQDVQTLIKEIQQAFQKTFGFVPEPEVIIVNS